MKYLLTALMSPISISSLVCTDSLIKSVHSLFFGPLDDAINKLWITILFISKANEINHHYQENNDHIIHYIIPRITI
jgi:hypothetical protein